MVVEPNAATSQGLQLCPHPAVTRSQGQIRVRAKVRAKVRASVYVHSGHPADPIL